MDASSNVTGSGTPVCRREPSTGPHDSTGTAGRTPLVEWPDPVGSREAASLVGRATQDTTFAGGGRIILGEGDLPQPG